MMGQLKEGSETDEWEEESNCSCSECKRETEVLSDDDSLEIEDPRSLIWLSQIRDERIVNETEEEADKRNRREELMEWHGAGLADSDDGSLESWEEDMMEEQEEERARVFKHLANYFDTYQWSFLIGLVCQDILLRMFLG